MPSGLAVAFASSPECPRHSLICAGASINQLKFSDMRHEYKCQAELFRNRIAFWL